MSIMVRLARGSGELWMGKTGIYGMRFEGAVLKGEKSVEERRAEDGVAAVKQDGEMYTKVGSYDPVLRAHCRL